jgi:tetraacyldisaccharide 4'-kinase
MQHRRLKRDFEIVVIDANDPFGKGRFLPRGLLREMPERLKVADLIVLNHVEDEQHYHEVQKLLHSYTDAPCVGTQFEVIDKESCSNKCVGLFCGIGKQSKHLETKWSIGYSCQTM